MGILLIIVFGGLIAAFVLLSIAARIVQAVSLIAIFIMGVAVVAIGYISIFVAGLCAAMLFQVWGPENVGWAIFVAGLVGLMVGSLLLAAIIIEVKCFSGRLKHRFGRGKTEGSEKSTPSVSR